jgi:signal transduction histidine kinase
VTRPSRWPGRKPRILTVLLAMNLVLLALPLGGLWMLRLYDSALLRQTEAELVAQAAVIGSAYRAAWIRETGATPEEAAARWTPRFPALDLARDPVLPPPPFAVPPDAPADATALRAAAWVQPLLGDAQRITLAAMRVTDAAGTVIASSGQELGLSLAARPEVAEAMAGRGSAVLRERSEPIQPRPEPGSISRSANLRVFLALPVQLGSQVIGTVVLSRTPAGLDQALHAWRWELAGLAAALVAAAALLAAFAAFTVGRPIRAVAAQAQAVAGGAALPARIRSSAVREADELSDAIARMAATLHSRADYIRGFATEVSHEFKTPLAGLRGAIELLQDHAATMSEAERTRFLAQAAGDVDRLERLTRRLLDLARAEAPAPQQGMSDLAAEMPAAVTPARQAGLDVTLAGPALRAAIAPEALRAVICILLDNTRQHAGPGAKAEIAWAATSAGVEIVLRDDGRGISVGNAARVFDRFFTTARDAGGTGLGLAIARSRVEAAGGSIALRPAEKGACFVLALPRG